VIRHHYGSRCREAYEIAKPINTLTGGRTSAGVALLLVAALFMNVGTADPAPVPTSAAFVDRDGMLSWLADGEHGLWVQASNFRWFYARFAGVCHGLQATNSLVFDTGASNRIDRTSSVLVSGRQRCKVQTFAQIPGAAELDIRWTRSAMTRITC
jgi:hypothetical protein